MPRDDAASQLTDRQRQLRQDLPHAGLRGELWLAYQPKFTARGNRLAGAEALLRWRHGTLGAIPPDEFIPLAEESGAIMRLSEWAIGAASRQIHAWRRQGLGAPRIAVNISLRDLREADLVACLHDNLSRYGIAPDRLIFEFTESSAIGASPHLTGMLAHLHAIGLGVAIDDFGTRHSNLSHLLELKVSQLKIDRSFVSPLDGEDTRAHRIVAVIIRLAHSLGIEVVAEGVETARQLRILSVLDCDQVQGYFLGHPLEARLFAELLAKHAS